MCQIYPGSGMYCQTPPATDLTFDFGGRPFSLTAVADGLNQT